MIFTPERNMFVGALLIRRRPRKEISESSTFGREYNLVSRQVACFYASSEDATAHLQLGSA